MNAAFKGMKEYFLPSVSVLLPFALFISILVLPIPISISIFFSHFSFPYFLLVGFLFYVSFSLKGKYSWLFAACVTALIFSIRLSYLWTSGYSNSMVISGLLPFKDAFSYYNGASFLGLQGLVIKSLFFNQSGYKPPKT